MSYYADPHCHEFRQAVAEVYGVTEEEVFVGNGADEVLSFVLMSFFRRGMKIYFPDITYGFYRTYAKTYGLDMEEIPVKEDFSIDIEDYMDLDGDIIFANPNNPTGLTIPVADIERLVRRVETSVCQQPEEEVTTEKIGRMVMEGLKELDEVAYIRFASVYRQFKDVQSFMEELQLLLDSQKKPEA